MKKCMMLLCLAICMGGSSYAADMEVMDLTAQIEELKNLELKGERFVLFEEFEKKANTWFSAADIVKASGFIAPVALAMATVVTIPVDRTHITTVLAGVATIIAYLGGPTIGYMIGKHVCAPISFQKQVKDMFAAWDDETYSKKLFPETFNFLKQSREKWLACAEQSEEQGDAYIKKFAGEIRKVVLRLSKRGFGNSAAGEFVKCNVYAGSALLVFIAIVLKLD